MNRAAVLRLALAGIVLGLATNVQADSNDDSAAHLLDGQGAQNAIGGELPGPSPVVFGRALDLEGTPLRLVRPMATANGKQGFAGAAYRGPFARPRGMPLRAYSISSGFGMRYHPLLGGQRFHSGLDFPAPTGTAVLATAPGAVSFAGWYGGYGLCVAVDHGNGYMTLFAHLSALSINQGVVVSPGTALGQVGSTGQSTGPHLHYEVRYNGRPIDPRGFL
jgi:murein DD-endopeptidase MepM/ murein hydrolase activator NlpD